MNSLRLTQVTNDGRIKTWRLNRASEVLTFGMSRKAKIISIDTNVESIESLIEFRDNNWHYINFKTDNSPADRIINNDLTVQLKNSSLKFEVTHTRHSIIAGLDQLNLNGNMQKQLIVLIKDNKVLKIYVNKTNETLNIYSLGKKVTITLPISEIWQTEALDDYHLKYKTLNTYELDEFEHSSESIIEKEDKKSVFTVLSVTGLLVFFSLFSDKKINTLPLKNETISSNLILKSEFNKRILSDNQPAQRQVTIKSQKGGLSTETKTASIIKNAIGARISKLIGKVSATESRTNNVLISTNGLKASENSSGRALAAVGKVESTGRNWNGEALGSAKTISTAGLGGGNSGQGLRGSLTQGKTGAGGVGLIENESEIIGGLDRDVIAQYIKTQLGQILYCYERQLSADPNLFGKIAVKFTIAGTGQVETQTINDSTLKNSNVELCILNKISKWKFPEPKGGTKVFVTYPFLFKSTI